MKISNILQAKSSTSDLARCTIDYPLFYPPLQTFHQLPKKINNPKTHKPLPNLSSIQCALPNNSLLPYRKEPSKLLLQTTLRYLSVRPTLLQNIHPPSLAKPGKEYYSTIVSPQHSLYRKSDPTTPPLDQKLAVSSTSFPSYALEALQNSIYSASCFTLHPFPAFS